MPKKSAISSRILKILGQKKIFSAQELKNKAVFFLASHAKDTKSKPEYAVARAVKNLKEAGFVEIFSSAHDEYIRLTISGQRRLHMLRVESDSALVSSSWDGLWRFVMLDMPEDRKNEREAIRYLLKKAGFVCLKNSVWVSPHPFEHLFMNIKKDMGLTTEMMIVVSSTVDRETEEEIASRFSSPSVA